MRNANPKHFESLSRREREVALLVAKGLMAKEIADQLQIAERTVEHYRQKLFLKLGVERSIELAHMVLHLGLIHNLFDQPENPS